MAQKEIGIHPEQPLTYDWKEHGFKVTVPAGAVSQSGGQSASPLNMYVQASLQGDFQFADGLDFISGVYRLSFSSPVRHFHQKVTIGLQHCASVNDENTALSFYTASDTPPYVFEHLPGGNFSESGEATIDVDHFTWFTILGSRERSRKYYSICTYYVPKPSNVQEAHITVTQKKALVLMVNTHAILDPYIYNILLLTES